MDHHGIRFLGHNIPRVLPVNFTSIFVFRIQNTSSRDLHFQSYASFYGTATNDTMVGISILLNGGFLTQVLPYNDRIHPGERAALFFPFRTGGEGEYHLEIVIGEQSAGVESHQGRPLFKTVINVKRNVPRFDVGEKVRQAFFKFLHTENPIRLKRLQLSHYRRKWFGYPNHADRGETLKKVKELNRELAFMEKQVRRLRVASFPCYLGWDTTSKCNLNCLFCFRQYIDVDFNSKPDMSPDTLDQLIEELFPTALTLNLSTVGEPLLSPQLDKILKACADYGVSLSLTTNGTLLKGDDFLRRLASVLHHIEISFDSASRDRFETLRSGASYAGVLQNVASLARIRRTLPDPKFNLGFSMTLFRENLGEIPDVLRLVSEVGGNFLKTDIGVVFSKKDLSHSVLTCPDYYNEIYDIAHEKARQIGIRLWMRPPFSRNGRHGSAKSGICDYLYLSACVRSEGGLNPCYFPLLDSVSVTEKGFAAAWNSEPMQRLRLAHDSGRGDPLCRDCYLVPGDADSLEERKRQFLRGDALRWGTLIHFGTGGNAAEYQTAGWSEAETAFTWTDGHKASLTIPIDPPTSAYVSLKARLTPFISPGKVDKQVVTVMINGKAAGIWVLTKAELQEKMLFIPKTSIMTTGRLEIAFLMPDAVSPFATGVNEDQRLLGLAAQTIELTEL